MRNLRSNCRLPPVAHCKHGRTATEAIHKRVAGIDVHRMKHVLTVLIEDDDGTVTRHSHEFGGFKRDMRGLVAWLLSFKIELVILGSTGIYWKNVLAHLEAAGILA